MGSRDDRGKEPTLAENGSIFNLTLDEVKSQLDSLGKPLSSMNLEELVRTVRAADSNSEVLGTTDIVVAVQGQTNSYATLSKDLGAKTVTEAWSDIQRGWTDGNCVDRTTALEGQPTLRELTLEDFLAKAGIVAEAPRSSVEGQNPNITNSPHESLPKQNPWMQAQYPMIQQSPFLHCKNTVPVFLPNQRHAHQSHPITMTYPQMQTSLSSPKSACTMPDSPSVGRKRVSSIDIIEKASERRHRRMIKNRESAARSRERKQAYTQQLELKLAELEEENAKLKAAEVPSALPPDTKTTIHRTRSALV